MSEKTENSTPNIVPTDEPKVPVQSAIPLSLQDYAEDLAGANITFEKIATPSGGATYFEIEGHDQPLSVLRGVILRHHLTNLRFEGDYDGSDNAPVCVSNDGICGMHRETGEVIECATCPYNQFGSGKDGGKECQNRRTLYFLLEGEELPRIISIPAGSLAEFSKLQLKTLVLKKNIKDMVVDIRLVKKKSSKNIDYSQYTFTYVGNVADLPEERQQVISDAMVLVKWAGSQA